MEKSPEPGPLLLELRNVGMLAMRLEDTTPEEWRTGWFQWCNSQDIAVLREAAEALDPESPYADGAPERERRESAERLRALAGFLDWYLDNRFELLNGGG